MGRFRSHPADVPVGYSPTQLGDQWSCIPLQAVSQKLLIITIGDTSPAFLQHTLGGERSNFRQQRECWWSLRAA